MAFEDLAYNENLQAAIKDNFPATYSLMKYNAKGTIKVLQAFKAINAQKVRKKIGTGHRGDDGKEAWADYKVAVLEYLKHVNSDSRLGPAQEKMATKIYEEHHKKFPNFLPKGKKESGMVNITDKDGYEIEKDGFKFFVAWSCEGDLTVTDNREDGNFYFEFEGKPTLKLLYVDFGRLRHFEQLALSNKAEAEKQVDKHSTRALTWNMLDED